MPKVLLNFTDDHFIRDVTAHFLDKLMLWLPPDESTERASAAEEIGMSHVCIQLYLQRANPGSACFDVWMDFAVWYQSRGDKSVTTIQALHLYFMDKRE